MGVRFKLPTSIYLPLSLLIQGGFSTNCTSTTGVSEKKKRVEEKWWQLLIYQWWTSQQFYMGLTNFAISNWLLHHVMARLSVQWSWDSSREKSRVPVHNQRVPVQLKKLRPLCNHTVNLETDAKTLYYSLLKLNIVLLYI